MPVPIRPPGRARARAPSLAVCLSTLLSAGSAVSAEAQLDSVYHLIEIRVQSCQPATTAASASVSALPLRTGFLQLDPESGREIQTLNWHTLPGAKKSTYSLLGSACAGLSEGTVLVVREAWDPRCDASSEPEKCWDEFPAIAPIPDRVGRLLAERKPRRVPAPASATSSIPETRQSPGPSNEPFRNNQEGPIMELQQF